MASNGATNKANNAAVKEKILQDALAKLHDTFLKCRTYAHAWDEYTPSPEELSTRRQGWHLYLRCMRCGVTRIDDVLSIGSLDRRAYTYPDGYRLGGYVAKDDVRRELFMRRSGKGKK